MCLALTAHAGAAAILVDVSAGANAIVINYGTPNLDISVDAVGNGYAIMFGAGTTLALGASGTQDVHIAADHGMYMTGATGSSKGAGTINAVGLYVNGVAVELGGRRQSDRLGGPRGRERQRGDLHALGRAPPLSQAITPTWTGAHTFAAATATPLTVTNTLTTAPALSVAGGSTVPAGLVNIHATSGGGPLSVVPNANNPAIAVLPPTGTATFSCTVDPTASLCSWNAFGPTTTVRITVPLGGITLAADGGWFTDGATGSSKGAGTLNATGLYINGAALGTFIPAAANPTAAVVLAAVNGSATTYMRSDAAPALSQAIAPTWTGAHHFTPSAAATPVTITAPSSGKLRPQLALVGGAAGAGPGHCDRHHRGSAVGVVITATGVQLAQGHELRRAFRTSSPRAPGHRWPGESAGARATSHSMPTAR